jgi:hypothetical protein
VSDARARAAAFVAAHGDERERRQAAALLGEVSPLEALERLAPARSAPEALVLLRMADDLRLLRAPRVEATATWLAGAQAADGSWGDLFTTGMLAGFLARAPYTRATTLDAAGAWLARQWAPERVKGGDWEAIAAFAHFFANALHEDADAALQWCGRELGRGFASGRFDAVRTARVLLWCDAHAIPGAQLDAAGLRARILAEQAPDGGWPSPTARVAHTLDALVALTRWRSGGD